MFIGYNFDLNRIQRTALYHAAEMGKFESVVVLLRHGASLEVRDRWGVSIGTV